jgi:hypothetical protein
MAAKTVVDSVKVRMYRHGFGDCFLLSFMHKEEPTFSMLVDCGIKHNTKSKTVPIEDVIEDIKTVLSTQAGGKPRLNVLVASHEHWDHIAFFHPTVKLFSDFEIDQVWLAWTENPEDREAVTINSRLREGAEALQIAAMRMQAAEANEGEQFKGLGASKEVNAARKCFNEAMSHVLGFYGVSAKKTSDTGIKYKDDPETSVRTEAAMRNVIALGKGGGVKYLLPGTQVDKSRIPGGINVYVLGPPRSSLMNKSNPSSGPAHETYFGLDHTGLTSFIDAMLQLKNSSPMEASSSLGPFGEGVGITKKEAENNPYFKRTYLNETETYRQIENCWLDVASQFALQLDGAINNTSLVLAIELENSGKVLLFPGDAQVGSWLSWHEYKWTATRGGKAKEITAKDLLQNTVLYKVSHHGSHNATVKDKGLELMTHPDLVAMMPEQQDCYSGIPHEPLMKRLKELCKGRVLVSADENHDPIKLCKNRPPELSANEFESFKKNLTIDRLYIEYRISDQPV